MVEYYGIGSAIIFVLSFFFTIPLLDSEFRHFDVIAIAVFSAIAYPIILLALLVLWHMDNVPYSKLKRTLKKKIH